MTYVAALREALSEELARDDAVFLMGEDIGVYGGAFGVTRGLLDRFGPTRVLDTPVSEQGIVGAAIGAALVGSRPVVEIMFMDFMTLAMDQLVNQAAKLRYVFGRQARCPMVVRTVAGGGRNYGPTHSQSLEAWLVHTPGLKVAVPSTPSDAKALLKAAIRDPNPVVFIEHKRLYACKGPVPGKGRTTSGARSGRDGALPFGRARVAREGTDLTIVAWSWMAVEAERAAVELSDRGVSAELIDLRTLSPMDVAGVCRSVKKTGRLLVVEEACGTGGVSGEIAFRVFEEAHDYLDAPIRRVTAPDVPVPASPALECAVLPDSDRIVEAALALV